MACVAGHLCRLPSKLTADDCRVLPYSFRKAPPDVFRLFGGAQLAFPDDKDSPAETLEGASNLGVALDVPFELGLPERHVALRHVGDLAPMMPMPETTMHEDNRAEPP